MKSETVGRKYEYVRYGVFSRRVGTQGWYGLATHKTEEGARAELENALKGSRYVDVGGGLTLDTGNDCGDRYERKLVKVVYQCEVLAVGVGPL